MNSLKTLLFTTLIIFILVTLNFTQTASQKKSDTVDDATDQELISNLKSANDKTASNSVVEIVRRGEKLISSLIKLKGDNSHYSGYCLGYPKSADFIIDGISNDINDGSTVSIEVVSLYLITAIYHDNIAFASVPYLVDNKPVSNFQYNTKKRINKAWESTEKWYKKMQKAGLEKLRKDNEFPLKSSKIYFVGTNPDRKRDLSDCMK